MTPRNHDHNRVNINWIDRHLIISRDCLIHHLHFRYYAYLLLIEVNANYPLKNWSILDGNVLLPIYGDPYAPRETVLSPPPIRTDDRTDCSSARLNKH